MGTDDDLSESVFFKIFFQCRLLGEMWSPHQKVNQTVRREERRFCPYNRSSSKNGYVLYRRRERVVPDMGQFFPTRFAANNIPDWLTTDGTSPTERTEGTVLNIAAVKPRILCFTST